MSNHIREHGIEQYGRFYGVYYGYVKDVNDPLERNRVLLFIPEVKGPKGRFVWAYPRNNYGGTGYGVQNLPELGDMVWVSFRQGHPQFPLWEHGYYAKDEKPEDFKETTTKGLITPKGIKIILDDDKETVKVSTPKGAVIEAQEDNVSVSFNDVTLTVSNDDLTVNGHPLTLADELKEILEELHTHITVHSKALMASTGVPEIGTNSPNPDPGIVQWRLKLKNILAKFT